MDSLGAVFGTCYQIDPKVRLGLPRLIIPTWRDRFPSDRISGIKLAYKRVIYGNVLNRFGTTSTLRSFYL